MNSDAPSIPVNFMFNLSFTGFGYRITDLIGFNSAVVDERLFFEFVISASFFEVGSSVAFRV